MSFAKWLRLFSSHLRSQKRTPRRPIHPLSGLYDWVLEDRCLLSGGVPVPTGSSTPLNQIMWDGGAPLVPPPVGVPNLSAPPMKTVTFQNTTSQTIYPFLRDANSGIGAGANNTGVPYDPQDPLNQEYRLYVGYVQNGQDYLGLLPGSSITVRIPLVFWNAENTYIATDGTNLLSTQPGHFGYDSGSTRGLSPITAGHSADGYWVTSFTSTDPTATAGFIMLYHAATPLTPALDAPAQLAEFTIRDPFLSKLGITSDADTNVIMDYDVSYVDNAVAPITVEASAVPLQIPTQWSNSANPPSPPFGWTGSNLTFTAMQTDIQNFYNNTLGSDAYIGQYFSNPNSPPPPPGSPSASGPGWPAYYATILNSLSGGGVVGTSGGGGVVSTSSGGVKIPGGQNIFLQSPLNGTTSGISGKHYMLTSGGTAPFNVGTGGDTVGTAKQTLIPLTLDLAQQSTQVAQLQSMLNTGTVNISLATNGANTLGTVSKYYRSGVLAGFHASPGAGYTSNTTYKLSGNTAAGTVTGTGTAYYNAKNGTISRVGLPHYNKSGIPIFTATPSITLTGANNPTTPSNLTPYVEGQSNGVAPTATSKGTGYNAGTYTFTIKGTTAGGVQNTATGTVKFGGKSGSMQSWSFPNYKSGVPIYTSTPSVTIDFGSNNPGTGAQLFANIGGGAVVATLNSGTNIPTGRGNEPGWVFTRPATDYAATDITNLWYTWAQYYINQYANMQPESVPGTLNLTGAPATKDQAAYIAIKNSDLTGLATPLAVGMTVNGNGITPAPETSVTIVKIAPDSNTAYTDFYLSQLEGGSTPTTGSYTFGKPQSLPYSDSTGIKNITVTNGGAGYVPPLTVTLEGGSGAGATAVVNGITNGQITSFQITNPGGNYSFDPTVIINGGGGAGAKATAAINKATGQVTSITINPGAGGSGYSMGTTVSITGGNGQASASAVVDPKTGAVTGIVVTDPGSGFDKSPPTITINGNGKGSGATATYTIGTYVSTYANLLPSPTTQLQGGTVLQFAGTVYEALEAEASIPAAQSLRFYNAVMPPPVGLVGTTIGSDLGDLPNSNGGASVLGGQVRDLIKSALRGVWNFEAVPESTQFWYPNPSQAPKGVNLPFNPFNLDPYVWFIHDVLGMSGYGFSTDDDVANVGAFTSPYLHPPYIQPPLPPQAALPNNLVIAYGGTNNLPQKQQWFPGVPWGVVQSSGAVSTTSGGGAFVTLAPGPNAPTTTQINQYYQIVPVTPGQSGGAYVLGPGIPAGTTVNVQKNVGKLQFSLNVPAGETVTPTKPGVTVSLTFTGIPLSPLLPPSPPPPLGTSAPPTASPSPPSLPLSASAMTSDFVQLVQDEFFLVLDEVFALIDSAFAVTDSTLESSREDYTNSINANPLTPTLLGQVVIYVTRLETLKVLQAIA